MKQTTDSCRQLLVDYVNANTAIVSKQFDPPLSAADLAPAQKPSNWVRTAKQVIFGNDADNYELPSADGECYVLREFDCRPYEDQLRGTVVTSADDKTVISVTVEGE